MRISIPRSVENFWLKWTFNPTYPGSFRIHKLKESVDINQHKVMWLATVKRGKQTARFRIEIILKNPKTLAPGSFSIAFSQGAFFRESLEDQRWYLHELAQAFEAKIVPEWAVRWHKVDFRIAVFGMGDSRGGSLNEPDAGFSSHPPGDWIVMKGFIEAEMTCEFYLNLNPKIGIGEFSIKDEYYGDGLVAELAKILLKT